MRTPGRIFTTILVIIGLAVLGFVAWANTPAGPTAEAFTALKSTDQVKVSQDTQGRLLFEPIGTRNGVGLIFYPGARVDPRAYAPLALGIATKGTVVIVVPMLFHLAVLSPERAQDIIDSYQGIRSWTVGGHSLGGAMAARFARLHAKEVKGLVLWAAYLVAPRVVRECVQGRPRNAGKDCGRTTAPAPDNRVPANRGWQSLTVRIVWYPDGRPCRRHRSIATMASGRRVNGRLPGSGGETASVRCLVQTLAAAHRFLTEPTGATILSARKAVR
jgi:hypothetical protein